MNDDDRAKQASKLTADEKSQLDDRFLESIAFQNSEVDDVAMDARVQRVIAGLERATLPLGETAAVGKVTLGTFNRQQSQKSEQRNWRIGLLVLSASVFLAVTLGFRYLVAPPSASAMLDKSLDWVEQPGARQYEIESQLQRPFLGERNARGELYLDGADRFYIRHEAMLLNGSYYIGSDGNQAWLITPSGEAMNADVDWMRNWLAEQDPLITPELRLAPMLERMQREYDLAITEKRYLDNSLDPGAKVACWHIVGTLSNQKQTKRRPRIIELDADAKAGTVHRLVLDWQLAEGEFGPDQMTFKLVGQPVLNEEWFHLETHAKE